MKKILFICFGFSMILSKVNGQVSDSTLAQHQPKLDARQLFQKSKKNKAIAYILLGGGLVSGLAGVSKNMNQDDNIDGGGEAAMTIGAIAAVASIPFFVMSSSKKKKAMNLSFSNETTQQLYKQSLVSLPLRSLTLTFRL